MAKAKSASSDEAAIRRLIEDWARAVRERDVDGILADHAPDILMFDVPPPFQSNGIDAYRRTWDVFFAWSRDSGVFDIRHLEVTAGSDVSFATALMRCAGVEKDGRKLRLDFRLTIGLRKHRGRWIVAHEHHSIPAE